MNNRTSSPSSQYITLAKIGAPHGVRGDLKLHPFTDDLDQLSTYSAWFIEDNSTSPPWKAVEITFKAMHRALLVHFPGCDDRNAAKAYVNKRLAVRRDDLAPLKASGQYYWADLEGLQVITTSGQVLGIVDYLFATGANDVMVVKGDNEYLLPFIEQVIIKVDRVKKQIVVDWDPEF